MVKIIYPRDWEQLRLACLQKANDTCEQCGSKDGAILQSKRSGIPSLVSLHAAHTDNDTINPTPVLVALCPCSHMRHGWQQVNGGARSGYGKHILTENLARAVRESGLLVWRENDGLHWSISQYHGVAKSPLEAVVQALSFLQTALAEPTRHN